MSVDPPVTSGLVAKHDARDLSSGHVDGDDVDPWPDDSGNGNDLTNDNPDGNNYFPLPVFRTNSTPDGKPAVEFKDSGAVDFESTSVFLRWPDNLIDIRSGTTFVYCKTDKADDNGRNAVTGWEKHNKVAAWAMAVNPSLNNFNPNVATALADINHDPSGYEVLAIRGDGDGKAAFKGSTKELTDASTTAQPADHKAGVGAQLSAGNSDGLLYDPAYTLLSGQIAVVYHYDRALTDQEVADVATFIITEMEGGSDTTSPSLSSATAAKDGRDGYTGSVDTDEGGTGYHVVTTSSTAPSAFQVKQGQNHNGNTAAASNSASLTSGTWAVSQTGVLSGSTQYWVHYMVEDTAGNRSSVASSGSFTTDSLSTALDVPIAGVSSRTGLEYAVFAESLPSTLTSPEISGNAGEIDGGTFTLDLSSTSLTDGDTAFLILSNTDGDLSNRDTEKVAAGPVEVTQK